MLKTVAFTWTQQEVSTEARTLLTLGTQLYDRLGTLAGHADDLRRALERTVDSYNRFAGSLETRVLVTARQFPGVDASALATASATTVGAARRFTAPELITTDDTASGDHASQTSGIDALEATRGETVRADVGDVRHRLDEG